MTNCLIQSFLLLW